MYNLAVCYPYPPRLPESDEKWIKEKHIVVRKVIEAKRRTTSFRQKEMFIFRVYLYAFYYLAGPGE